MRSSRLPGAALAMASVLVISACADLANPKTRMGMVKDPSTGLMFGSVVEKNITTDPSFYANKRVKVRVRNTSGDTAFDLRNFVGRLEDAYAEIGYQPTSSDDFGILVDVNVRYSGQVQRNLANEFTFLGAAAGGIAGSRSSAGAGTAIGVVSGATLGNIVGSFITDDTYIIVADVTVGIVKGGKKVPSKTITFSRSPTPAERAGDQKDDVSQRGFRNTIRTGVSVFAGGRNTPQTQIAGEVRQRLVRIVSNII